MGKANSSKTRELRHCARCLKHDRGSSLERSVNPLLFLSYLLRIIVDINAGLFVQGALVIGEDFE